MAAAIFQMKKKKAPADTHRVALRTDELLQVILPDHVEPVHDGPGPADSVIYRGDS